MIKSTLAILVALFALGLVGQMDYETDRLEDASYQCANYTPETEPTFQTCVDRQMAATNNR